MQNHSPDAPEVLAVARASMARRVIGLGALAGLGVMLLHAAFTGPLDTGWRVALSAVGLAFILVAEVMRRGTASAIELTETALRDADGTVILRLEEIVGIDQGIWAIKPSNGFVLRSRESLPRGWRPGLWWRFGRRVGVGGMTPARETKLLAEILTARLAEEQAAQLSDQTVRGA